MMMARSNPSYFPMEEHSLELLFHDQSRLAECLGQTEPFGLEVVRSACADFVSAKPRSELPSYVAGILIVPLLALLMARFGFRLGGAFAAWLVGAASLAFAICHRGKGYGLVALFILSRLLFLRSLR